MSEQEHVFKEKKSRRWMSKLITEIVRKFQTNEASKLPAELAAAYAMATGPPDLF